MVRYNNRAMTRSTPSSSKSALTSLAKELGYQVAAQAMGPYGTPVMNSARAAYNTYKRFSSSGKSGAKKKFKGRSKAYNNTSTGVYAGKFKKGGKVKNTLETSCSKLGLVKYTETDGSMADPHAAYFVHSTFSSETMAYTLMGTLFRKLFLKAGHRINDIEEELPLFDVDNSDGFKIKAEWYDVLHDPFHQEFITSDNENFQNLLQNWNDFRNRLKAVVEGNAVYVLAKLHIYQSDRNGVATNWRLASTLHVENEVLTLFGKSTLTIQNRTKGDLAGTDASLERVDNQPLSGQKYYFSTGYPRLKASSGKNIDFSCIPESGLRLIRSGIFANIGYQNMPEPQVFKNLKSSDKLLLQPGQIKKSTIFYKKTGKFNEVLYAMAPKRKIGENVIGTLGRCEMLGFEELLRTAAGNLITLQYERQYVCGAKLKSTKSVPFLKIMTTNTVNNLP